MISKQLKHKIRLPKMSGSWSLASVVTEATESKCIMILRTLGWGSRVVKEIVMAAWELSLSRSISRTLCFTMEESSTSDTFCWLVVSMDPTRLIGLKKGMQGPHHLCSLWKGEAKTLFTSPTMRFRSTAKIMENSRTEIRSAMTSWINTSRGPITLRVGTLCLTISFLKWSRSPLMLLKQPTSPSTPQEDSITSSCLEWISCSITTSSLGSSRSTLTRA